jgi:sulfonate transport system substrate-binding protein
MRLKRRDVLYGLVGLGLPIVASSCTSTTPSASNSPAASPSAAPVASPAATPATAAPAGGNTVRIGYQRFSDLDIIRKRGTLDKLLEAQGAKAEWTFFQAGPPMLEAINAGSIDFGGVGEAPPIFAQASGVQFYYVGITPRGPETQDIVVPKDSAIKTPADLKGKKVALQKGSSAHYLLVTVLKEAGLSVGDVEVVSLPPADARAAFEQGNVDAWSIWDPFLAVIESTGKIQNLKVGRDRRTFFLAAKNFVESRPEITKVILESTKENEVWGQQHTKDIAKQFAADLKIDAAILETVNNRRKWGLQPADASAIDGQQKVADTFYDLKLIPKSIQVKDAFVPADLYAKIYPG